MKRLLVVLALVALAVPASADVLNIRQVDLGSGDPPALQTVFNNIGATSIDVANDQLANAIFAPMGSGGSVLTLIIEVAGYSGTNTFGIYEYGNHTNRAEVFNGAATAGQFPSSQNTIAFLANGNVYVDDVLKGTGFGTSFGFYLGVQGGPTIYYSEDSLNGGLAQALIFAGEGNTVTLPGFNPGLDTGHYYIAFEDMPYNGGDHDFNDFVVMAESITPVPEPGSMLLLGSGLIGLAGAIRRRVRK